MSNLLIWDELALLWNRRDFRGVHDWLNERWAHLVQESMSGERDTFARFLQGLAFAALAFHFVHERNEESAGLFVEDALKALPCFAPVFAGISIAPILDALNELHVQLNRPGGGCNLIPQCVPFAPLRFSRSSLVL